MIGLPSPYPWVVVGVGLPIGIDCGFLNPQPKGNPMTESEATYKADEFVKLMIQHQANLFGSYPLDSPEGSKKAAQALAALRAELIDKLLPQK